MKENPTLELCHTCCFCSGKYVCNIYLYKCVCRWLNSDMTWQTPGYPVWPNHRSVCVCVHLYPVPSYVMARFTMMVTFPRVTWNGISAATGVGVGVWQCVLACVGVYVFVRMHKCYCRTLNLLSWFIATEIQPMVKQVPPYMVICLGVVFDHWSFLLISQ